MTRTKWLVATTLMLAVALVAPQVAAQQIRRETAHAIPSVEGVDLYNAYCAVCHGKDGKGNGPAAVALKTPMPDLTTMAKRNAGKYSAADVEAAILGKGKMTPAHGSPDMPIWGPVFRSLTPDEAARTLRVTNLVKYIETMQAK
jgi:mono/diheme cytochrome c family protein